MEDDYSWLFDSEHHTTKITFPRNPQIGDKVRIKSLEWYNKNKDVTGTVQVPYGFVRAMSKFCGNVYEVIGKNGTNYTLSDTDDYSFSIEMFDFDT